LGWPNLSNDQNEKLPYDEFMIVYAVAFFFRSAQRFFMPKAILLRASSDSKRFRLRPSGLREGIE
jgi:hypothetical protein